MGAISNGTKMTNMKKISTICFLVISPLFVSAQHSIIWEPEITVADGSVTGNVRPRLSLTDNDLPVVLIGKSGNGELFVVRGNGTGFDAPVQVTPPGLETYLANWTGPDIASKGNNVVVVFKAQTLADGHIYAVRSTDGGITFGDTLRVDNYDIGRTWMPALDMDENGNPHVTYMIFDAQGADERIVITSSIDGGATYLPQQVVTAAAPGVACDCCPPEIVTKGQYQLALFRNNESNVRDIWGALSTDGGLTFTSDANLDNLGWGIASCPATGPHGVILGDSAYVVSASRASGKYRVYASSVGLSGGLNVDHVQMMLEPTTLPGDSQNFPRISGSGDTLVMVWEEKETGNTDILCAVATDGLVQTLGAFKSKVNATTDGIQSKPDVILRNGIVHVIYEEMGSGNVIYRRGTVADVTNVSELKASKFELYPNPAQSSVTLAKIDPTNIASVTMTDQLGREISITQNKMNGELDLTWSNEIQSGTYTILVRLNNGQHVSEQLVIEN
jgi:hypothetical protein